MRESKVVRWLAGMLVVSAFLILPFTRAQDLFERTHVFTLDNELRVIMVVQDYAPVIAFELMFDVGGIDEPEGLGGIAHMVEHIAFKGTRSIGSLDLQAELEALREVELAAIALEYAEAGGASAEVLAELHTRFAEAQERAQALALPNALNSLLSDNGAAGLNARTSYDFTDYIVSLPSNRLELYARIYADVLANNVFRYFYEERDVVREERRQRNEDDPNGFLREAFYAEAFQAHPYGRSLIGAAAELERYQASQAEAFYRTYYHPNRAVLVMVGDLEPERDIEVIRRYFETVPPGPQVRTQLPAEPPQTQERRIEVSFDAEPQVLVGYHKPTYPERDAYVMDVISALLSDGRTSRLYRRMVLEDRIALTVSTGPGSPGIREPNLFVFAGQPRFPHTSEDLEAALYEELERLKAEPVGERELEKVRNRARASIVRVLASSSGLASNLAYNELFAGGWENLVDDLDILDSVTAEEIMAVAQRYFTPENRTVATLVPRTPSAGTAEERDEQ